MSKKVAFLTTVFPMKDSFIFDFFDSLKKQTYKNFEIIVLNDGYENFATIKEKYNELSIIELKYSNTPAKNREFGINYVIENSYDVLIFGDSDDYFSINRVEKSLELLKNYDIVVNDLSLFDNDGVYCEKYISHRLSNLTEIEYEFIKDKNIFGLSNTTINVSIMSKINIDKSIVAVDWFIYKKLLKSKNKAIFTNEIETYYRQYENNTIGLNPKNGLYLLWWEKVLQIKDEI